MHHLTLKIGGMSCGHCVARVEKALAKLDGVAVHRVELGTAEVFYDPSRISLARIRESVDESGYTAHPVDRAERVA